ncbi:transposase [Steroidobacter sp. S1-65]|uniref:Transposase n=1 Tax=Steroidobacter gossypii TaxID=2805490 RepID=A0ABS1X1M6_9GAMM|nr:transposase [Steroidobacter gossypii]
MGLVISDAHERLKAAAAKVLKSTWRRCRVDFPRNALAHANKGPPQVVLALKKKRSSRRKRRRQRSRGDQMPHRCRRHLPE